MTTAQMDLSTQIAQIKGARVVKGFCYSCPWTCATEVYVRDKQVVYVKGNSLSPFNMAGRCGKGMASPWVTKDPDRLKHPMRRKGPKGSGQFERVSWDTAFDLVAENLTRIFAHGFTTRKQGHGFGLHSGALTAKELGGALLVESEGPGRGATFILELPHQAVARAA